MSCVQFVPLEKNSEAGVMEVDRLICQQTILLQQARECCARQARNGLTEQVTALVRVFDIEARC